jgi:hypothetical protein
MAERIELSDAYVIHVNYDDLLNRIARLPDTDKDLKEQLVCVVNSLRDTTRKLEPALTRESHDDEYALWDEYTDLQKERLLVLDLDHEYDILEEKVEAINPEINVRIKDALEELKEHISVRAETHRAYIDILGIKNARRLSINAILVSATIAYLAVWEYSVREFINSIGFPDGLSPVLNYLLSIVTILPVFAAVVWAILNRRKGALQ